MAKSKQLHLGPRLAKKGKYAKAVAAELRELSNTVKQIPPILDELAEILENILEDK